ncbi:helix-turn-helix domain-containing protein [Myxococcus sp. CA039A]|uniref:helix-turn-helix domain-containing protein n=1 Tax=Myxococcus sp. CA039A TaxID=2741737 RepID=UPI00157AB3D2|nr:helix-turn-helix domain-containing protein [Myxococcus sp. CA039A]NTX57452.1 helix-turn-helix domain-containing protein [Myxococcus sp. CA039A]
MNDGLPTPEKLRQTLVRAFQEKGLTYGQIARLLGIGEATVSRGRCCIGRPEAYGMYEVGTGTRDSPGIVVLRLKTAHRPRLLPLT